VEIAECIKFHFPSYSRQGGTGAMKVADEVHTLCLTKNGEHYVLMYDAAHRKNVLHVIAQWANNPDLSFGWYDAARLSHEVRRGP